MATKEYGNAWLKCTNKEWSWQNDVIKVMLVTSSYVFNQDTHIYKSSVLNEVVAIGYVAGGATLTSKTSAYYGANSSTSWVGNTVYTIGTIVRPSVTSNGHVYIAVVAGTSAASAPIWPTSSNGQVTDGGSLIWKELGNNVILLGAATANWPTSTITAAGAIVYASTGVDGTSVLLAYEDFGGNQSSSSGNFTISWDPAGIILHNVA